MALADDDQIIIKKYPTPDERAGFYDMKIKPLLEGVDAQEFRDVFVNSADSYRQVDKAVGTILKNILDIAGKKGMAGMLIRNKVRGVLMGIAQGIGGKRKGRKTRRRKTKRSTRRS